MATRPNLKSKRFLDLVERGLRDTSADGAPIALSAHLLRRDGTVTPVVIDLPTDRAGYAAAGAILALLVRDLNAELAVLQIPLTPGRTVALHAVDGAGDERGRRAVHLPEHMRTSATRRRAAGA